MYELHGTHPTKIFHVCEKKVVILLHNSLVHDLGLRESEIDPLKVCNLDHFTPHALHRIYRFCSLLFWLRQIVIIEI